MKMARHVLTVLTCTAVSVWQVIPGLIVKQVCRAVRVGVLGYIYNVVNKMCIRCGLFRQ